MCCLVLVFGMSSFAVLPRIRALLDYVRTTAPVHPESDGRSRALRSLCTVAAKGPARTMLSPFTMVKSSARGMNAGTIRTRLATRKERRMTAKRWLITVIQAGLIAWALLYLATYFDVPFVREAGGRAAAATLR